MIGRLREAFTNQFRSVNTFFFGFDGEPIDKLFRKVSFDFFHGWMLLTSLRFLLPLRRFDTRFVRFGL